MKLILALPIAAMLTAPGVSAPCKDTKGRFTKCPPATASVEVTKDSKGKCHVASGPRRARSPNAGNAPVCPPSE